MRIRRSRLKGDYVQLPNATARDQRLNHMARGILAELLSRPDGWEATADDMWRASVAAHGKDSPGRRQFRAAFAELKEHGYLTSEREDIGGGRHATVLTLTDVPHAGMSARPGVSSNVAGGTDVPHAGTSVRSADVPHGGTPVSPAQTDLFAGRTDVPLSDVPHAGTSKEENKSTNTRNTQQRPARPVDPEPRSYDTLRDLKRAISAAGISGVNWDLKPSQIERIRRVCEYVDISPMVAMALSNFRLKGLPAGASAWISGWESLEPDPENITHLPAAVGGTLHAVPARPQQTSHNASVLARYRQRTQQEPR